MEKDVLEKYKMNSRAEAVAFLKSLWNETPQPCPLCNGKLDFLHKKAKKNNSDWKCTGCGERYDAMKLLNLLNEGFGRQDLILPIGRWICNAGKRDRWEGDLELWES